MDTIDEINQRDRSYIDSLRWWEKKRILFNGFVGITGIISMILFAPGFRFPELFLAVVYAIAANVCYSLGFVLESLDQYYFNGKLNLQRYRWPAFCVGMLFAAWITFSGCQLYYFDPLLWP